MECYVEGNFLLNIIWFVGGEFIDFDLFNNSYILRVIGVFDCMCSVCNGIGKCVNLMLYCFVDSKCVIII